MRNSTYHILLRVSALTLAFVLMFDSGLLSPITKQLSQGAQQYVANVVGVKAVVEQNEMNVLTAQISARERELDDREAALASREINVGLNTQSGQNSSELSTYILSIILFIIVVMLVLNYALDFARDRRVAYSRNNESIV